MAGTKAIAQENGKKGGRPKGSTTKPRLKDYLDEKEVKKIISKAKKKADEGDTHMLKFILDHIFGKAPQSMDLTTQGDKIVTPIYGGLSKHNSNEEDIPTEEKD